METADNCRRAAREAVADVEPPQLHEFVETVLDEASMVPGVLTVKSAALVAERNATTRNGARPGAGAGTAADSESQSQSNSGSGAETDPQSDTAGTHDRSVTPVNTDETGEIDSVLADTDYATDALVTHAAGVQLIYEGLRLTRTLAHEEPWIEGDSSDDHGGDDTDDREGETTDAPNADIKGDLEILAADILVARGFYLLARTNAAGTAVRTVQSFGRDQTRRNDLASAETESNHDPAATAVDPAAIDANLERDILELAVETGAAAVDESPSGQLLALVTDLADAIGPSFPPAPECLADIDTSLTDAFESVDLEDRSLEDRPTDRATSATDH